MEGVGEAVGPVAGDDVGDGEEGAPVVGQAIGGDGRQGRVVKGGDGGEVVFGPARDFAAEDFFDFGFVGVEAELDLAGLGLDHGNDNGAVAQGGRQVADAGQDGWAEGVVGVDVITAGAAAEGVGVPLVAGVEEGAHFAVEVEVAIHFVHAEGGLAAVDDAVHDGRCEAFAAQGTGEHRGHDVQAGGFAAAMYDGKEVEARAEVEGPEGVGMRDPDGEDDGGASRGEELEDEALGDFVEQGRSVENRLGPGVEVGQYDGIGLGIVFEAAAAIDFAVEGGEAQAEAIGFGTAGAVVLGEGKLGEAVEGGVFGFGAGAGG